MARKKEKFIHHSKPLSLSTGESSGDENGYAAKVVVVSESEILHAEGNVLRLDAVFSQNEIDDCASGSGSNNSLEDDQNRAIACNPLCQGFACFAFSPRCGRVAYSPRSFQPKIHIEALRNKRRGRKKVCTISDGASIEYSSMEFDHNGDRIAAIGKGSIDAKLWVWQLPCPSNSDEKQMNAHLIFCYELDRCASICLFSPSSSVTRVGLVFHESSSMMVCLAKHFTPNEVHVDCSNIILPVSKKSSGASSVEGSATIHITCAAWENQDRSLVGDSAGCLYIYSRDEASPKHQSPIYSCLRKIQSPSSVAPLKRIIVLRDNIIAAFECGRIEWIYRGRLSSMNAEHANNIKQSIHIKEGLADLLCNPSYETLTGITATGGVFRLPGICNTNDGEYIMNYNVLCLCRVRVTALQVLVLAGKIAMPIIIMGSEDGILRAFRETDYVDKFLHSPDNSLASIDIGCPVSSLSSLEGSPVFAVGAGDGSIRFIHVSRNAISIDVDGPSLRMTALAEEKVGNSPVSLLSFSAPSKRLAVYCKNAEYVFIISTEPNEDMKVVGKIGTYCDRLCVASLVWANSIQNGLLLVADIRGTVTWFDTADTDRNVTPDDFHYRPIRTYSLNGISRLNCFFVIRPQGAEHQIYAAHVDSKGLTCFTVPFVSDCDEFGNLTSDGVVLGGSKDSIILLGSVRASVIISGTSSGEVLVFKVHRDGVTATELIQVLPVHAGPVVSMIFNADGSRLYSVGADGSLFVHAVDESNIHQVVTSSNVFDSMATKALQSDGRQRLLDVSLGLEKKRAMELAAKVEIEALNSEINDMKSRLIEAIADNARKEDDEKLDDKDLVVDDSGMAALNVQTECELNKLLNSILSSDSESAIEAVRIRQQYWDDFEYHSNEIKPLFTKAEHSLRNFTIGKLSNEKVNMLKSKRCLGENLRTPDGICSNDVSIARRGYDLLRKEDILNSSYFSRDGVESTETEYHDNTLLNPLDIQTNDKRQTQIILLQAVIREKSMHFNNKFESLRRAKQLLLQEIDSKNGRIEEIANELGKTHVYEMISLTSSEVTNSVLTVFDNELQTSPYETCQQKSEREEREEQERQAAAKAKTGETARALHDMMHGILQVKKKISAPVSDTGRKEWMDEVRYEDMSEEQKKIFHNYQRQTEDAKKAYEQQYQILEDERQTLHRDMKSAICQFNEKWQHLLDERFQTHLSIGICQVYTHCLQQSVIEADNAKTAIIEADIELDGLIVQQNSLVVELEKVLNDVDDIKGKLQALNEQDKALSKTFRRQIQGASSMKVDQETVKMLSILYRNRDASDQPNGQGKAARETASLLRRSSISRYGGHDSSWMSDKRRHREHTGSISIGSDNSCVREALHDARNITEIDESYVISANDPFVSLKCDFNVESKGTGAEYILKAVKVRPITLRDIPEGFHVNDEVMERLNNLRFQKVKKENEIRILTLHFCEVQCYYERLNEKREDLRSSINQLKARNNEIIQTTQRKERSQELILRSRQGQNELDREVASIADYSESTLLPLQSVQDINLKIRLLGDDKICTLNDMRLLKRKMNRIKWENDYLDLRNKNAREEYTDIQMLRVTKQVKLVLSGDENEKELQRVESMKASMSKMKKNHEMLFHKLDKEQQVLSRSIKERMHENDNRREQLQTLHKEVEHCEKANPYNSEKKEKDSLINHKKDTTMKRIQARRKLVYLSRSQNEEIHKLNEELEKLLRKTFPTFSRSNSTHC